MADYLLTYNPDKFEWKGREAELREIARASEAGRVVDGNWSIARKHDIGPGDRVYLVRQVSKPRGIIASGIVASSPYPDTHWDETGKLTDYVDVHWTQAVPFADPLRLGDLRRVSPEQHWEPQQSGIVLRAKYAASVAELWDAHVRKRRKW
jgi:hypothetical protein